jgi:hypothetical protein
MTAPQIPAGASLREAALALGLRVEGRTLVPADGSPALGPFPDAAAAWEALRERHPDAIAAIEPLPPAGSAPRPETMIPFARKAVRDWAPSGRRAALAARGAR